MEAVAQELALMKELIRVKEQERDHLKAVFRQREIEALEAQAQAQAADEQENNEQDGDGNGPNPPKMARGG